MPPKEKYAVCVASVMDQQTDTPNHEGSILGDIGFFHLGTRNGVLYSTGAGTIPCLAMLKMDSYSYRVITTQQGSSIVHIAASKTNDGKVTLVFLNKSLCGNVPTQKAILCLEAVPKDRIPQETDILLLVHVEEAALPVCDSQIVIQDVCSAWRYVLQSYAGSVQRERLSFMDHENQPWSLEYCYTIWQESEESITTHLTMPLPTTSFIIDNKTTLPCSPMLEGSLRQGRDHNQDHNQDQDQDQDHKSVASGAMTADVDDHGQVFSYAPRKGAYRKRPQAEMNAERKAAMAAIEELRCLSNDVHDSCCKLCGTVFSRKFDLRRHLRTVHMPDRQFTCSICYDSFQRAEHLRVHQLVHTKTSRICTICNKPFISQHNLERHVKVIHGSMMQGK
eukprot:CAMPEP_0184707564 /NCGR_PEP_ID=MMETSP0313-20130426/37335_1 /TAXON_ID=2792 /ORGANISM="Porphyridium aerugineum, Strain SAG 1380-2" /LENGTH=391 /DNA_ID=CAMNT_0027169143 /DNA_START=514 /DNA_END=1689 /DNA_ORIENTATION=-